MPGVKTTTKIDEKTVLEPVVKPLNDTLFQRQHWIFQQNSMSAHKSICCQEWLGNNIPAFIHMEDWTSDSPGLNPFNYELWDILEQNAC